jgi:hypothetical protein
MNTGETPDCYAEFCQRQAGGSLRCRPTSYPDGCIHDTTRPPLNTRRARALQRTDRMKFPGPGRPDPIAEQVARVPEDVLTLVLSTLATLAAYRNALRAGREAELDGIHGAGRNTVRRHGRARLANALPVLRHFVRQGRPWDIDPYAVLRHLMPRSPSPIMGLRDGMRVRVVPGMPGVPDPRRRGLERGSFAWWMVGLEEALAAGRLDESSLRALRNTHAEGRWTDTEPIGRSKTRKMTQAEKDELASIIAKLETNTDLEELSPPPLALDSRPAPASPDTPTAPDPGSPHGTAVPGAPDASETPEGPILPPEPADRSGAPDRRSGRRGRTMPGQGSLFD